jgi:hypothetical protein
MNIRAILAASLCCLAGQAQTTTHAYGLLRAPDDAYLNYRIAGVLPTGVLPAQASVEQFLPPPGHQGTVQGSCTAWSTTFALRTALQVKLNGDWRPPDNAAHQFSPAFVFNKAKASTGLFDCTAGIQFATALNILQVVGAPTLNTFPYDPTRCDLQPTAALSQQARQYRIGSWERTSDLSLNRIKAHLAAGDPVLAGIDVYPSFDQAQGPAPITGTAGEWLGYHAIALIGYDDSKLAFRLQNSWGPDWGDHGRAWIDYSTFSAVAHEAYRVNPVLPPSSFDLPVISSTAPSVRRFGIVNDSSQPGFADRIDQILQTLGEVTPAMSADATKFAVRVNAFENKDQALSLARNIVEGSTGLAARIIPQTLQGKVVYSVLVAADVSSAEASLVLSRAKKAGFSLAAKITLK